MATGTTQDEKLVGIVPLEPDWSQPGIERLGPPPGNAEILIRGGAGWVFGIPAREETPHPRIERLGKTPSQDEVAFALACEMAWRRRPASASMAFGSTQGSGDWLEYRQTTVAVGRSCRWSVTTRPRHRRPSLLKTSMSAA